MQPEYHRPDPASATLPAAECQLMNAWWRAAPITCRWARSTCWPIRCCAKSWWPPRQAAAAWPFRHGAGAELHLRAPQPGDQGAGPRRPVHRRAGATGRPASSPTPGWSGTYSRDLSGGVAGRRGGDGAAVPAILLPGRHSESRRARDTPGSIHEGGELGYSLVPRLSAPCFDNPDLLADVRESATGRPETGPLATRVGTRNKFLNPVTDGARAARPASERLQDRESDCAGPYQPWSPSWRRTDARLRVRATSFVDRDPIPMQVHQAIGRARIDSASWTTSHPSSSRPAATRAAWRSGRPAVAP